MTRSVPHNTLLPTSDPIFDCIDWQQPAAQREERFSFVYSIRQQTNGKFSVLKTSNHSADRDQASFVGHDLTAWHAWKLFANAIASI